MYIVTLKDLGKKYLLSCPLKYNKNASILANVFRIGKLHRVGWGGNVTDVGQIHDEV